MNIDIHIIGYYGHSNLGDESYLITFKELLKDLHFNLIITDCDKINTLSVKETDIIIIGGGDVLNDYFMDKIISKFNGCKNKIIAVSVGLPFKSVLKNTNKLNIIDYIFIRTQQDIDLFSKYYHPHRIFYLPDISYLLINNNHTKKVHVIEHQLYKIDNDDYHSKINFAKQTGKKIIGISLNRHIYNKNYQDLYNTAVINFSQFIKFLINFNYHIVFLPFNTNNETPSENDNIIHTDIINELQKNSSTVLSLMSNITNVHNITNINNVLDIINTFDFYIPMRFHACLFSIYKNIPFFPIFTTRKIKNLLLDINWAYGYELETNDDGLPINIDINIIFSRFVGLVELVKRNEFHLKNKLNNTNIELFGKHLNNNKLKLIELLNTPYSKESLQTNYKNTITDVINFTFESIQKFSNSLGYYDFRLITDDKNQDIIVNIVSFKLTNGSINSIYNFGLKAKMFNISYNYKEEWKWILNNEENINKNSHQLLNNPYGIFDIGFVDQVDYSGAHRSGWQYVYNNIKYLHNSDSNLLLDLYIDRTFHWNLNVNKVLNLIPYTKNWIGFIHHTFDTSFSKYNCYTLINNKEFQESLKYCKGLFVLSKFLQQKLSYELEKLGFNIRIYHLVHPTEICVVNFSLNNFIKNSDKKILHVGGWLRNVYTFYNLNIPADFRKVAVLGKNMSNYYPKNDFIKNLHNILIEPNKNECMESNISSNVSCNVSSNVSSNCNTDYDTIQINNNWYKCFFDDLKHKLHNIDFIEYLDDSLYDTILSENIVFIHLIDASAVNTVIECIVRNTPIIVNKHPAIIELLGETYPLYFTNYNYTDINQEIKNILTIQKIKDAHLYMTKLDKQKYTINYFINNFIKIINELT